MVKKLLTFFMGIGLAIGASAQSIDTSLIQYWVGTGSNAATFTLHFNNASVPVSLVWGYRWNDPTDSYTVGTMMDEIDATDSRVTFDGVSSGFLNSYSYTDENYNLTAPTSGNYAGFIMNNDVANLGLSSMPLANGDNVAWCDADMSFFMGGGINIGNPTVVYVSNPNDTTVDNEATIANSDILYWVGTGSNEAILIVDWGTNAFAWGYRFDGDKTALNMASAIDAADPRLAMDMLYNPGFYFCLYPLHLYMDDTYRFKVNGVMADNEDELSDYDLANGTVVKISNNSANIWSTTITPATVETMPVSSTIDASQIHYWVGTGTDSAVVAINWGMPDTALAWGLLFNGSISVTNALDSLAAGDARLSISSTLTATYIDSNVTLAFQTTPAGNTPQFILDGDSYASLTSMLTNGSFLKLGESAYGHGYDSTYWDGMGWWPTGVVWSAEIHPVSNPNDTVVPQDTTSTTDTTVIPQNPVDATIAASDIVYWVGEGSNKVVFAVNWADTALAWGYKFSTDSILVEDILDGIQAADQRFSYTGSNNWMQDINFVNADGDTLALQGSHWMYNVNGQPSDLGFSQKKVVNNSIVKFGDIIDGFGYDYDTLYNYYMSYTWTRTIYPVSVPDTTSDTTIVPPIDTPIDATIAASDIVYWVGEGSNKVVFAVNWADTALAWGYKFSTDSVLVETILDDIAAADPRFSYVGSNGWMSDINFVTAAGDTLGLEGLYWMYNVNGIGAGYGYDQQKVVNNDIVKFGDVIDGTGYDYDTTYYSYMSYAWTRTIYPVSVPDTTHDGIDEVASIDMTVYPNPASEVLNVRCEAMQNGAEVSMFDMTGHKVYSQRIAEGTESIRIATAAIPNGVYMLRIGNSNAKVVVRH